MLTSLRLLDFRCYHRFQWDIPAEGSIIIGDNAQGKTSLLEAVCFLLRLQSPRSSRTAPMIAHDRPGFGISGDLLSQRRKILWGNKEAKLFVNQEQRPDQKSYLVDSFPVVWMGNNDLHFVTQSAENRRKYLDFLGSQWNPLYRQEWSRYRHALKNRNYLLKHKSGDKRQIEAFTILLSEHGEALILLRQSLLALLKPHLTRAYNHLCNSQEDLHLEYKSVAPGHLLNALQNNWQQDLRYGQTQIGPHRDDIVITLNRQSAQQFASEGQQRSIAIALRLAQSSLLTQETGLNPIHLIDDVFGELDPKRRLALLTYLSSDSQNLITTTHLDWLKDSPIPLPLLDLKNMNR